MPPQGEALAPGVVTPGAALHPVARSARALRTLVHVLRGLATTRLVFPFVTPAHRRVLTQRWSATLLRILHVECRALAPVSMDGGNLLLVANHVSWLDIIVLNALCPSRFVAKAELARWPVAGRMARDGGTLFIERSSRRDAHRISRTVTEALLQGDIVAVFPEGTTSEGAGVLPFKSSLLQAVVEARGEILPLALRYRDGTGERSPAPAYVGDDTIVASFWRVCGERRLTVEVMPFARVAAAGRHRRELAAEVEGTIRRALD